MEPLFSGRLFNVVNQGRAECVIHPGASVILPFLSPKKIIFVEQYRPCIQQAIWELPAGVLEPGEDPKQCAQRELQEETGYRSARLMHLCSFYTTPGFSNEKLHAFVAEDLHFVGKREEDEAIQVHIISLEEALEMVRSQKILDGKTLLVLTHYLFFKDL